MSDDHGYNPDSPKAPGYLDRLLIRVDDGDWRDIVYDLTAPAGENR